MINYSVTELPPLGYGNADASISLTKKLERDQLDEAVVNRGAEIINEGSCMADITEGDDGCIDGRHSLKLLYVLRDEFHEVDVTDPFTHKRAKVAGGGYMTSLMMKLALDPEVTTINEDITGLVRHLTELGVYCGVHTGSHIGNGSVDCGANDKFDVILRTYRSFQSHINQTIEAVMPHMDISTEYSHDIANEAGAGLERTLSHEGYFDDSNGQARFDLIMDEIEQMQKRTGAEKPLSVSKHLADDHNEAYIILNTVPGKTFSQAAFRQKLQEEFPDVPPEQLPQAFVVDLPRVVELAEAMSTGREDKGHAFRVALQAGIGFQIAAAATLTDGSLRNFIVS